jgi:hypothetical protein
MNWGPKSLYGGLGAALLAGHAECALPMTAAPQPDFASNERALSLLEGAQHNLAMTTGSRWRQHWQSAGRLLSDIDRTIEGGSAQRGPGGVPIAAGTSLVCRSACTDRHLGELPRESNMDSKLMKTALAASIATGLAGAAMSASATTMPLQEQHYGQIAYATGGIGENEAKRFESEMSRYPLAIEVFEKGYKREEFTAGADVKIADQHGHTVFDAKTGGPFLLVKLPKGKYSIEASLKDKTLPRRSVYVEPGHTARAVFEFPPHTD